MSLRGLWAVVTCGSLWPHLCRWTQFSQNKAVGVPGPIKLGKSCRLPTPFHTCRGPWNDRDGSVPGQRGGGLT